MTAEPNQDREAGAGVPIEILRIDVSRLKWAAKLTARTAESKAAHDNSSKRLRTALTELESLRASDAALRATRDKYQKTLQRIMDMTSPPCALHNAQRVALYAFKSQGEPLDPERPIELEELREVARRFDTFCATLEDLLPEAEDRTVLLQAVRDLIAERDTLRAILGTEQPKQEKP